MHISLFLYVFNFLTKEILEYMKENRNYNFSDFSIKQIAPSIVYQRKKASI